MWSSSLPRHPQPHVADEHKAIFEAALAQDADMAVVLMTRHLETTARHLEAVAPDAGATFGGGRLTSYEPESRRRGSAARRGARLRSAFSDPSALPRNRRRPERTNA